VVATVRGTRIDDALPGRQGRLLFVFLTLNRLRATPRPVLLEALWHDGLPDGADSALSALLSKLRRALGHDALAGRGEMRLVLDDGAWVDFEAAGEALHRAEGAVARGDWPSAWVAARIAQHISSRGFLPGEEADWVAETRRVVERRLERSMELAALASLRIGGSELDTAERTARALVAGSPYSEVGYRMLMETLAARGERARALLVFEELRRRLRDELGSTPSPETQELHRSLLR
jgi:DNA-binding SARP family transcriptional activator